MVKKNPPAIYFNYCMLLCFMLTTLKNKRSYTTKETYISTSDNFKRGGGI